MFKTYHNFNKSDAMHLLTLGANRQDFAGYCIYKRKTVDDLLAPETVISFVVKGEKVICTQDGAHHMKAGDALLVKAGTGIHSDILWKERAFESINIVLNPSLMKSFYYWNYMYFSPNGPSGRTGARQIAEDCHSAINISRNVHLKHYVHSLLPYFRNPLQIDLDQIARFKFFELLSILLATEPVLLSHEFNAMKPDEDAFFHGKIVENIMNPISIEELARLCHMSLSTFKRKFVKLYGESPRRWMIRKRLDLATILLATTSQNITEICFNTGFENLSHFIMTFRAHRGMTPTRYRLTVNRQKTT